MGKTIFTYLIIGGAAAAVGITGGIIGKRYLNEPIRDYSGFDANNYKIDGDAIIAKIESYNTKESAFNQLPAEDLINYAFETYRRCENSYSFSTGLASASIVSQQIRSCQIKNGNTYFEESVSKSSMVGVGNRMVQEGKDGGVTLYKVGNKNNVIIDSSVSIYNPTPIDMTKEEYATTFGRSLDEMFIYLIHKDTVLSTSSKQKLSNNEGYEIILNLDPDLSTYCYQFQMLNISGLDKMPIFKYVTLTYKLNNNFDLISCHVDECYEATMGVSVTITNSLNFSYFPNTYYKIPELTENFDYLQKGAF